MRIKQFFHVFPHKYVQHFSWFFSHLKYNWLRIKKIQLFLKHISKSIIKRIIVEIIQHLIDQVC